jgi:hypothetical protein
MYRMGLLELSRYSFEEISKKRNFEIYLLNLIGIF